MTQLFIGFRLFMQEGGGALLLPELMLCLFAMGILLTDHLLEPRDKYFNALMAMLGVIFSGICLWQLRDAAERGAIGFSNSLLVDPFFLFFSFIFLIATAMVILLSVRYLQIEDENHGEYYALMMFATVGMMFMVSGYDLVVEFLEHGRISGEAAGIEPLHLFDQFLEIGQRRRLSLEALAQLI